MDILKKYSVLISILCGVLVCTLVFEYFFSRDTINFNSESYMILEYIAPEHLEQTKKIKLRIARDRDELVKGLSGTDNLPHDEAMLFVFNKPDVYSFWMKDMKYPLDIVWLDSTFKVVHIESNVAPESYPLLYTPSAQAQYVLEFNAGTIRGTNVDIGNILKVWYNNNVH